MAIINGTFASDDGSNGNGFPLFGTPVGDTLNANFSTGDDLMFGGSGNDRYKVNSIGDEVVEAPGNGTDTVISPIDFALGNNFENLNLVGVANIDGTGNSLSNVINGNNGNNTLSGLGGNDVIRGRDGHDILDGGTGEDLMIGGAGNDTYFVDNANDIVRELQRDGTDRVYSSVSYVLGDSLENLSLAGVANIDGTGNSLSNVINGNNGNNTLSGLRGNDVIRGRDGHDILDGGTGEDLMIGGAGNDTYFVDNANDIVRELQRDGTDRVYSSVSYVLGDSLENLSLAGVANIDGTGNSLSNGIRGNSGNNTLSGLGGNDLISGGSGNDIIRYLATNDSGVGAANRDIILDFDSPFDRIDLSAIDANNIIAGDQAFNFIGTNAFTGAAGQVRYFVSGTDVIIQAEIGNDGDIIADMEIQLNGVGVLAATDFML